MFQRADQKSKSTARRFSDNSPAAWPLLAAAKPKGVEPAIKTIPPHVFDRRAVEQGQSASTTSAGDTAYLHLPFMVWLGHLPR